MPRRILLTGFQPYPGAEVNPTARLMGMVSESAERFPGAIVRTLVLDTAYDPCEEQLASAVEAFAPEAILSFGLNPSTDEIRLERIAVNVDDAKVPDTREDKRCGQRIVANGPVGYWATAPIEAMLHALQEGGIPATISNHAGAYVCNHLLYYALHLSERLPRETLVGFVHVPPLPEQLKEGGGAQQGMTIETMLEATGVCVGVIVEHLRSTQEARGRRQHAGRCSTDLSSLREQFPSLQQADAAGRPYVYFDGPGGTHVPRAVIAAMEDYLVRANANVHGPFLTSRRTDETVAQARQAAAHLLNAPSPEEIVFGSNMTTLTLHISRALARELGPGDEVIVTWLDHDANIAPWMRLQEQGVVVRWADLRPEDCTLDLEGLERMINERTRLIALGYASNAVGTINDVARIVACARQVDAWTYVDAVHYAPHGPIDVQALGCDFLVCSAYKLFGPHLGVLWGRREILERLQPDKVRPAPEEVPECFETGTKNHEGLAGLAAAVDYLADVGDRFGTLPDDRSGRRGRLAAGLTAIQAYERDLVWRLIEGLKQIPGLRIWGITDPAQAAWRVPTVSFTHEGLSPQQMAQQLADEGIFAWAGNFYALAVTERLGLEQSGGLLRVGLVHYNTAGEVGRLLEAMGHLQR